jgi:hypothetical protein
MKKEHELERERAVSEKLRGEMIMRDALSEAKTG